MHRRYGKVYGFSTRKYRIFMKINRRVLGKIVVILACLMLISSQGWAGKEPDKWDAAGKEISEAAKAVGNASSESWQKSKEITVEAVQGAQKTGTEVWDKTKEKSSAIVDKTVEVSGDVATGTAEKSKGFWQNTKDTSKKWYDKAKAKIHEMTAPDSQQ